eukprot:COSAG02_NODE_683_length_18518_cov_4.033172_18_plen_150_part_00
MLTFRGFWPPIRSSFDNLRALITEPNCKVLVPMVLSGMLIHLNSAFIYIVSANQAVTAPICGVCRHLHNNWLGEAQLQDSFVTAVVENYALSLTSAMIVTLGSFHKAMSGFAVTAHLRAPSPQRFVVVPGCREMSLDEVIRVQSDWSIV